jgi:nucleotide-binding universal stress UspA family protein
MSILCDLPASGPERLLGAARPLAAAIGQPLLATTLFDAASQANPLRPAEVVAAQRAAAQALESTLPSDVGSAGLALRLNGEPEWAPAIRCAIETGASVLAIDARGGIGRPNAGPVVRASPVPVLVIGPRFSGPPTAPAKLLVLSDGSEEAAAIGPALAALLAGSTLPVELLAVSLPVIGESPQEHELDLARTLEELEHTMPGVSVVRRRVEPARAFESVAAAVLRLAAEDGATCLAMATHGRGKALRLLLGSVADALLRDSHLPLILVPAGTSPHDA